MLKFFGIIGLSGVLVTGYLVTVGVGPVAQLPPEVSLLERYREEGVIPENRNLPNDHSAEDAGTFEVPEEDEVYLEAAREAMGDMDMGGMDMSNMDAADDNAMAGMDMSGSGEAVLDMDMNGDGVMDMSSAEMTNMGNMNMEGSGGDTVAGMDMSESGEAVLDMDMDGDGVMDMSSSAMGGDDNAMAGMDMSGSGEAVLDMDMDGDGVMDMSSSAMGGDDNAMAGMEMSPSSAALMGEGGLLITDGGEFDRVIELTMTEWGYSDMEIDLQVGERIKFVIKNDGQIPHEFMFMDMALMAAANYRGTRADWSLLEHEALFEKALMLPGGDFEMVVQITQPGSWMFMCMLPYHMQLGMMGQMSTPGMAMDMQM